MFCRITNARNAVRGRLGGRTTPYLGDVVVRPSPHSCGTTYHARHAHIRFFPRGVQRKSPYLLFAARHSPSKIFSLEATIMEDLFDSPELPKATRDPWSFLNLPGSGQLVSEFSRRVSCFVINFFSIIPSPARLIDAQPRLEGRLSTEGLPRIANCILNFHSSFECALDTTHLRSPHAIMLFYSLVRILNFYLQTHLSSNSLKRWHHGTSSPLLITWCNSKYWCCVLQYCTCLHWLLFCQCTMTFSCDLTVHDVSLYLILYHGVQLISTILSSISWQYYVRLSIKDHEVNQLIHHLS